MFIYLFVTVQVFELLSQLKIKIILLNEYSYVLSGVLLCFVKTLSIMFTSPCPACPLLVAVLLQVLLAPDKKKPAVPRYLSLIGKQRKYFGNCDVFLVTIAGLRKLVHGKNSLLGYLIGGGIAGWVLLNVGQLGEINKEKYLIRCLLQL